MHSSIKMIDKMPRLPLEGSIDLTYRCNNHCRHCWLWVPDQAEVQNNELTFDEIRRIVREARKMGCRHWSISGGEPLLRPDFPEIFEYITDLSIGYTLNTNGTLITPKIAKLLKKKGVKMIALYGADAEVYDHITRHPGGFEKVMQGFAYLKEAGAGFIVQLIPMQDNYHQWNEMISLAESLSAQWRVGAAWLFLSCDGSPARNKEILAQRLKPHQVIELSKPNPSYDERIAEFKAEKDQVVEPENGDSPLSAALQVSSYCSVNYSDDRLFARCIENRRDFHIDAYGQASWCCFIKDPDLRFDLRRGSFEEAWEKFIPSCSDKIHGGDEWREHCGSCAKRNDCHWCAVYSYLETGRYSAPIPYLCSVADETERFKQQWQKKHRRYFRVGGVTVRLESDLDFDSIIFKEELQTFAVDGPGDDNVTIRHYFEIPDLDGKDLGQILYHRLPWSVSRKNGAWIYRGITPEKGEENLHRLAIFSADYNHGTIYSTPQVYDQILKNGWHSLTLFSADQIWLGPLLANRFALLLHSAAAIINGNGFVFVGHSGAGKSTSIEILKTAQRELGFDVEILCDDRNIVRRWSDGWRVHGTWRHSTMNDVSSKDALLRGIVFLEQAKKNEIVALADRKMAWRVLLATMIRTMVTTDGWQKTLDIMEELIKGVPCYIMRFDKSGKIIYELERLTL